MTIVNNRTRAQAIAAKDIHHDTGATPIHRPWEAAERLLRTRGTRHIRMKLSMDDSLEVMRRWERIPIALVYQQVHDLSSSYAGHQSRWQC